MNILGFKPGHDGAIALIEDGKLLYSIEGEKSSFPRYMPITPYTLLEAAQIAETAPDCIAIGGWQHTNSSSIKHVGSGYWGIESVNRRVAEISVFGRRTTLFEGTHESSHIWGAYGMSPFADHYPCYVLIWEGQIGRFYRLDEGGQITAYPQIVSQPGSKYQFLYTLGDQSRMESTVAQRYPEDAGKIMALAAFGEDRDPNYEEAALIKELISCHDILSVTKRSFARSPYYNIGIISQPFKDLARAFSNAICERFMCWARENLDTGIPLAIGGGCGLNCDWNSAWAQSNLFSTIFVPPCANDSGSAIGSAIQAQQTLTGRCAVEWNVYCGSRNRHHGKTLKLTRPDSTLVDLDEIVLDLSNGEIIAVMRGLCEIGPRALGNRSLIADPRDADMHRRLNELKQRESYRPIAPMCTAEAAPKFFDIPCVDKYMLFLSRVRDDRIPAVTHVDQSARLQVVSRSDNSFMWSLLSRFGEQTGVPVLCNTSLNRKGRGFIDEVDDLLAFCKESGIRRALCDDQYIRL